MLRRLSSRLLERRVVAPVLLACILLAAHADYLAAPSPLWDEQMYLDAAALHVDGQSPYSHRYFNYPPPLVQLIAAAMEGGWSWWLVRAWRVANLGAVVALAWFSARRTGWSRDACLLVAIGVGCSPVIGQALRFGNLSPLVAYAALAALALERRRPWMAAIALGLGVALKPIALGAAAFLSGHRLLAGPRRPAPTAALAWPLFTLVALIPGFSMLPGMAARMSRAYFDPHHLSIKRVLAGLGIDLPATWIAAAVLLTALALSRRRALAPEQMVAAAPVVALLCLPVVWAHTFALTLPLQARALAEVLARWRWRRRLGPGVRESFAMLAVVASIAAIQGSASAALINDWPPGAQILVCLVPTLAPSVLLLSIGAPVADPAPAPAAPSESPDRLSESGRRT